MLKEIKQEIFCPAHDTVRDIKPELLRYTHMFFWHINTSKQSGNYMHHLFNLKKLAFFPHTIVMCLIIPEMN
jgi:hypothetical protein